MLFSQASLFNVNQLHNWSEYELPVEIIYNDIFTLDMLISHLITSDSELNFTDLPIEIVRDQIQFGKLSNRHYADCITIKNKSHLKDYYHFTLTAKATFDTTLITIYRTGRSALLGNNNSKKIGKATNDTFKNDAVNIKAIEAEKDYYLSVVKVLKTLLN